MAHPKFPTPRVSSQGWEGWDEYAPFYDWENQHTLGRRDVLFWQRVASEARGRVLELGCGTGRISVPLAKAGVDLVGVDRSRPMLARARRRIARNLTPRRGRNLPTLRPRNTPIAARFVRADIRALPFRADQFDAVLAPYGVLQSLLSERDLVATIRSVARVLASGGRFGIDLVPDVPRWREYRDRELLRGRAPGGRQLKLIESVRQNLAKRLTTFEERFVEHRGHHVAEHRFTLTFRTLSVRQMARRVVDAGFSIDHVVGDYRGGPWDKRADVWIILAKKM
jgi:SAM-dependent methyltransferase